MTICSAARSLGGESWRRHRPIADNAGDKTIHFSNVFISFLLNGPDGNGKEMIFISEKSGVLLLLISSLTMSFVFFFFLDFQHFVSWKFQIN